MLSPVVTVSDARLHQTFSALLWSRSNPGRIVRLPAGSQDWIVSIGESLVDPETPHYSPDPTLTTRLSRIGSRWAPPHRARFHFYPTFLPDDLTSLEVAPAGGYAYPDESATIVVGCAMTEARVGATSRGTRLRLADSGLSRPTERAIVGVPDDFWAVRARVTRFPYGWDLFLVSDGGEIVGIPRATTVEILP